MNNELPRDVFIQTIFNLAKSDEKIIFMSADLGAKALDQFRAELPNQFIHPGISEQSMIDVAAGLSMQGNKVVCYAMAPFITSRCLEQIKVAIATQGLALTLVGVGVGYGYDSAGPTHYATEDIAWMSSLVGMEIFTPSDNKTVEMIARNCIENPGLRYIRLDRKYLPSVEMDELFKSFRVKNQKSDNLIFTTGFMTPLVAEVISDENLKATQIDLFKNYPVDSNLIDLIRKYKKVITVEEHFLSGGLSSKIAELMCDNEILLPHLRIGIKEKYYFENGGREYLHELAGLDKFTILNRIKKYIGQ
ncbi:MAG: transketolase [Bacteriovoracaceae bacterium]|jgi:transketolase